VTAPNERELDALMARLADGDRAAFDPLFAALHPRALAVARMRLEAADADDAAQQALVRVFARARDFVPGRPVLPWFYAVVANEVHAIRRRRARGAIREAGVEAAGAVAVAPDESPEVAMIREELRASARRAIGTLDEASAEAIRALLGDGPPPDVAPATFRKRVSRAYARLRILLGGGS
jgi:RNA polymerase sigma factor (sigma-70 family)